MGAATRTGAATTAAAAALGAALAAVATILLGVVAMTLGAATALAAEPSPTAAGGGDVRTDPTAPGLVGDPLLAIGGVLAIGLLAVALTLLAARLAERR